VGKKRHDLYYLLPGDRRSARQRFWRNMTIAAFVGLLICGLMTWLFWHLNQH
jgi:hypothetical protein